MSITAMQPGDEVYVSLRYFNTDAYDTALQFPNKFSVDYVVKMKYTQWDRNDHTKIEGLVLVFGGGRWSLTPFFVEAWGARRVLLPTMYEVTLKDFPMHPELLEFVPPR